MAAATVLAVPGAGKGRCEGRQTLGPDQGQVFGHRALNRPIGLNAGVIQFAQGATADPADHHGVHRGARKGLEGLAVAVEMVAVGVD